MTTVYLSGPMTGLPDDNYPAFNATAKRLRSWGWSVINPAESFGGDSTKKLREYMRWDVEQILLHADAIALMPGWEQSEGARFELLIAQKLDLPVYNAETMVLKTNVPVVYTVLGTPPDLLDISGTPVTADEAFGQTSDFVQAQADGDEDGLVRLSTIEQAVIYNEKPYSGPFGEKSREWVKKGPEPETVLQEAQRLVYGDRQASYGHPADDYTRTGRLWSPIIEGWLRKQPGFEAIPEMPPVDPRICVLMMGQVKVSREVNAHKRDNFTDLAGYAGCGERIARRQAGEE